MLGERKSSMCRSRVARGHFTLMAAGPIEMTAALHDLKVRRQRIIFHRWRRGIGGVKWCLPNKLPLLRWIIAEQPRWNQHSTKARRYYTGARRTMKTDQIARAPIHHNEKFCDWKFRKLCLWKQETHQRPLFHTGAGYCFNRWQPNDSINLFACLNMISKLWYSHKSDFICKVQRIIRFPSGQKWLLSFYLPFF